MNAGTKAIEGRSLARPRVSEPPAVGVQLRSAIALKAAMAISGIVLFGFVFVHMLGNLKLYQGPAAMNSYGRALRELGSPLLGPGQALWIARIVLLLAAGIHIWAAAVLTLKSRQARPQRYRILQPVQATYASRTMRWGGVIVLLFVLFHLADLTFGTANPQFEEGLPYENVVASFSRGWVSLFYVLANLALGLHLYHGLWSLFQSLGWNHPWLNPWRRRFAAVFAVVITLGNVSFPISVWMGWVQ